MRALLTLLIFASTSPALCEPLNVPPGQDPGGVAIGLLAPKLDLSAPALQRGLARDGEGVAIGWDFSESEQTNPDPASKERAAAPSHSQTTTLQHLAGSGTRVIPVFVSLSKPKSWAQAVAFLAKTPARLIVVQTTSDTATDWVGFAAAARHFKNLLFIAPAHSDDSAGPPRLTYPAALNLDNVISVSDRTNALGDVFLDRSENNDTQASSFVLTARTLALCGLIEAIPSDGSPKKQALAVLAASDLINESGAMTAKPTEVRPCSAAKSP